MRSNDATNKDQLEEDINTNIRDWLECAKLRGKLNVLREGVFRDRSVER